MSYQDMFYKQCTLKSGIRWYHSWLPETLAVKGKTVQFKNGLGHWGYNWKVISVGKVRLSEEYVKERERDYLNQRDASDI